METTQLVCLHAAEEYEEVHNVSTQNDYKTKRKKWTDKKKTDLLFVFRKCVQILRKQVQYRTKEFLGNKININKKKISISWKSHWSQWSLHDKYGRSKAQDWRYLIAERPLNTGDDSDD